MIAKIAGSILVPPGIIFLLLVVHRRRSSLIGTALSLLLLYLLSIDPFVNFILSPSRTPSSAEALRGASAALHEYIGLVYYFLKSLIH